MRIIGRKIVGMRSRRGQESWFGQHGVIGEDVGVGKRNQSGRRFGSLIKGGKMDRDCDGMFGAG